MSSLNWSVDLRKRSWPAALRSLAAGPLPIALIVLVGVAVRVVLPTAHHAWGGISEFDDGVHLGAAQLLFSGHVPYRDFAFLQPPGIVLLLQPLAALARLIGDDQALIVGRAAFVAIGALNTCLAWKLLRPRGKVAAAIAAGFYAAWWGTVVTERTILLEPLLNLGLLVTLLLVQRASPRAVLLAGLALGLTSTIKLWPLVFVPVFAVWLARSRSVRMAARFLAGAIGSFAVVITPFWIIAGRALPHQLLFAQLGRHDRPQSLVEKLRLFDGLGGIGSVQHGIPAALLVLVAVLFTALALRLAMGDREVGLWFALLVVGAVALALAPSFYYHYPAFLAVPLAAVLGSLAAAGWRRMRTGGRSLAAVGAVLAGALLAVSAARGGWNPQPVRRDIPAVAQARCAFADIPILLITTNHFGNQTRCGYTLDSSALVMADGRAQAGRTLRAEFARATVGLLWGGPSTQWGWTAATVRSFRRRFTFAGHLPNGISLWKASPRDGPRLVGS
jgi:alpha-1,2-mannosyltransferase